MKNTILRKLSYLFIAAFIVSVSGISHAKRGGSKSYSRSAPKSYSKPKPKTNYNKPKSNYSKPKPSYSKSKATQQTSKTTSTRTQRPAAGNKKITTTRKAPPSIKSKPGALKMSNLPRNQADKAKAKTNAAKLDSQRRAKSSKNIASVRQSPGFKRNVTPGKTYTSKSVASTRKNWYRDNRPNRVAHIHYGNTGGFDPGFLGVMMMSDNAGSGMFWYGMTGSPWFAIMMSQQRTQAAQSNDRELFARLDRIEAENARLKANGTQPQPGFLPEGVPAEVAFSEEVLTGIPQSPTINVSTGMNNGIYATICSGQNENGFNGFSKNAQEYSIEAQCNQSSGSDQNIKRYVSRQADAMLTQADNLYLYQQKGINFGDNQYVTHQEPMWLLVNRNSNIENLEDIGKTSTVYTIGGSANSWKVMSNFAKDDTFMSFGGNTNYSQANHVSTQSIDSAIASVKSDSNAAVFLVMGSGAKTLQDIDKNHGNELQLIPVNDNRFESISDTKGQRIYSSCQVPANTLPNLQQVGKYWSSQDAVDTLCIDAIMVVSPSWVTTNQSNASMLALSISDTIDTMGLIVNKLQ